MSKKFLQGLIFTGVSLAFFQEGAKALNCKDQLDSCDNSCPTKGFNQVNAECVLKCIEVYDKCIHRQLLFTQLTRFLAFQGHS